MVEKWNTLEVKEGDSAKQEKTGGKRNHRLDCSRPSTKPPWGNGCVAPLGLGLPARALTFLLAARGALLLQQALAVEGGQRGGRVLLDSWVGLGERVHRAGRAVRQACCAESSVQGRHTWEHLSNFTKNPTIEKRNCTCSLVLSESCWYYTTLTTTAVHAARHFTKWDWGQRNTTLASGPLQHKGCTVKWTRMQPATGKYYSSALLRASLLVLLDICASAVGVGGWQCGTYLTCILVSWPLGKAVCEETHSLWPGSSAWPYRIRSVLLIQSEQRTLINCI